jgi:hypothetical protein
LLHSHIIQKNQRDAGRTDIWGISRFAGRVGIGISTRTVQRVARGNISPVSSVSSFDARSNIVRRGKEKVSKRLGSRSLVLGPDEVREIWAILERSARTSYLEVGELEVESRGGGVVLKAQVFEPEDEYE